MTLMKREIQGGGAGTRYGTPLVPGMVVVPVTLSRHKCIKTSMLCTS